MLFSTILQPDCVQTVLQHIYIRSWSITLKVQNSYEQ
jgi:hypothetical protein